MSTSIEWTDETWNPTTGCDRISAGCDNCYALTMAKRLKAMGQAKYQNDGDPRTSGPGFGLMVHPDTLNEPFTWTKPRKVFVNSMSDLFHARVPLDFIRRVFEVIEATPQHTYQVLTKRATRLPRVADRLPWPANLWMGVSVENQEEADRRIPSLLRVPAAVRWISAEPLLGPVDLSRWLGKDECCGCPSATGGRGVPSDRSGGADDRLGRPDLAGRGEARQPVGRADTLHSLQTSQGGERDGGLLAGPRDVPGGPRARHGASAGLASLPGADPGRAHGEPQERHEDGQQAEQSGTGHPAGAGASCPEGAATGKARSVRHAQRDDAADHRAGSGDLFPAGGRGASSCARCGLRRPGADHLTDREGRPTLSWVVVGGESGPGARPMHPSWPRSLRDQCTAAGVAFHYKQHGEWIRRADALEWADPWTSSRVRWVAPDGSVHEYGEFNGSPEHQGWAQVQRVGKKAAGRVLDGRTWDEFPPARMYVDTAPQPAEATS